MTLTTNQLKDICLLQSTNRKKTCRYLMQDELEEQKWYCKKLYPEAKSKIDNDVFVAEERNKIVPSGDNCTGYPFLRNIDQGYDVD